MYSLLLIFSGCGFQKASDNLIIQIIDPCFVANQISYYGNNKKWPNSITDLKSFCSEKQDNCLPVDWNKYKNANFKTLPDGSLKVEVYIPEDNNDLSKNKNPNLVMTIQKPKKQNDVNDLNK